MIIIAATIRDVAALAGVSPSTVSRTCRNSVSISRKTQEKVRAAMAALGYEPPNAQDASSNEQSVRNIGVILPPSESASFENPFFLEVLRGISAQCNRKSVITSVITGKDDQEILDSIHANTKNHSVSAYIVLFSRMEDPIVDDLYNEGIDYVQIGQPASHPNETVAVDNDNLAAGQEAARYLYSLGHKKIAFVGSGARHHYSAARKNGIRLYLQDQGLDLKPEWTIEIEEDDEAAMKKLRSVLTLPEDKRPDAVIASDEMNALMIRKICAEEGLSIPKDLSIISFNNSIVSRLMSPALTSIDINARQLGIEAALQAIKHLENPDLMPSRTLVPFQLIERESCQAIA